MTRRRSAEADATSGWMLAIETSNPSADGPGPGPGVAVRTPDGEIGAEPLNEGSARDDDLLPAIERLRERLDLAPSGLGAVAVSLGPGGYTALRTSIMTAATLAEVNGARLFGVPTSLSLAEALDDNAFPALICLASKRGTAHATVVAGRGDQTQDLGVMEASSLHFGRYRTVVADRFLPQTFSDAAHASGTPIVAPTFDARLVLRAASALPAVPPAEIRPLYGREPEAVRQWRLRHTP